MHVFSGRKGILTPLSMNAIADAIRRACEKIELHYAEEFGGESSAAFREGLVKEHNEKPVYDESFTHQIDVEAAKCGKKKSDESSIDDFEALDSDGEDPKFWEAVEVAVNNDKVSTSLLQRRAGLGYGRAAKIIDRMEQLGFVGPADGNKPRKLLITAQDFAEMKMNGFKRPGGEE